MNNAKQIAETVLSEETAPPAFQILASAYLELKKRNVSLLKENTLLILDSIEPRTDKDVTIVGLKKEITKLTEEIEKLKKSRDVLRKAVEFYGDEDSWQAVSIVQRPLMSVDDLELVNKYEDYYCRKGGKKAREAIKADDEIFADKVK